MKVTKSHITAELKKISWYEVMTFNSHRSMPAGCKGMPDHMLIPRRCSALIFIEVKLYKDKASSKQKIIGTLLSILSELTPYIRYYIMTEKNYEQIISRIIKSENQNRNNHDLLLCNELEGLKECDEDIWQDIYNNGEVTK